MHRFLGRFVAYPSAHAQLAHALWIAHAHAMKAWDSTPRIAFLSPEPGSGKTRALEVSELLVPRPVEAVNATPAYLFRKVSDQAGPPTILYDEIDTLFGPKAKDNEEVRGMLNAGHRRGAMAGRCVVRGKVVETEELPAYCAVALAGLGDLPDTLMTRSVVIRMKRRSPDEQIEPYRRRVHLADGHAIRDDLAAWATSATEAGIGDKWPEMPDGIADRAADVWECLLMIADAAGGDWPEKARVAAVALVADSRADSSVSLGIRLLGDVRSVWDGTEGMHTEKLLGRLNKLIEAPWGDLKGSELDPRRLSSLLRKYEVRPGRRPGRRRDRDRRETRHGGEGPEGLQARAPLRRLAALLAGESRYIGYMCGLRRTDDHHRARPAPPPDVPARRGRAVIVSVDAEQLAAAVLAEGQRHPPRSAERRAASHLWSALITSPSIAAARNAITTFGEPATQSDAEQLLGRLAAELAKDVPA